MRNDWRHHIFSGDDSWNLVSYEIGGTQTQVAEIDHRHRISWIPVGDGPETGALAVPVQAIRLHQRIARSGAVHSVHEPAYHQENVVRRGVHRAGTDEE